MAAAAVLPALLLGKLVSAAPSPFHAHGGEGEGDPEWVLVATKGGFASVHALFKEPIKSPLKGMQVIQLSSSVSEKRVRIFL